MAEMDSNYKLGYVTIPLERYDKLKADLAALKDIESKYNDVCEELFSHLDVRWVDEEKSAIMIEAKDRDLLLNIERLFPDRAAAEADATQRREKYRASRKKRQETIENKKKGEAT